MKLSKKELKIKLYTLVIILYPILNNYKFILPIGDILAISSIIILLPKKPINKLENVKLYKMFILYSIISLPFCIVLSRKIDLYDVFTKNFHLILYMYFALYLSKYYFDKKIFVKYLENVAFIVILIQIFEQLVYTVTKTQIYMILPNLTLNYAITNYDEYIHRFTLAAASQGYRPSSLFLEPAHFATFAIIVLSLELTKVNKSNKDYLFIISIIISIIFSYSTGGIMCCCICIIYYFVFCKSKNRELLFKIALISIGIFSVFMIINSESRLFEIVFNRINSIGSTVYDTSGNRRILRGFYIWDALPNFNKIFGTGTGNLLSTIVNNNIMVLTDTIFSEEMNAFLYLLSSTGIVGLILYFKSIVSGFLKKSQFRKLISILYLVICYFNNLLFHSVSIMYLLFIFMSDMEYEKMERF